MFVTSHLCNWEWLLQGVTLQLGYPVDAAYKPLHDAWAERLMLKVRSRFGARLIPAKELLADFLRRRGDRARGGDERGPGAGVDGQALLDAIPGPGHRLLRRRRTNRARHPTADPVSGDATGEARLLRGGDAAVVGRARDAAGECHHRALRAGLRARRARSSRRLVVVVPPLAPEEAAVRGRLDRDRRGRVRGADRLNRLRAFPEDAWRALRWSGDRTVR